MTGIQFGRVVDVHPEAHAVDVVLMDDGRRLSGVQVLSGSAGGDYGRHGLGIPTETGYDAKTTRKRDVFCAIGWCAGNPVVLGFLFPQVTQMLFEDKELSIDRHPSDVYSAIDGDGNFEMRHPSGAYVRIAEDPASKDLSSKDYCERWKIERNTDKRVHIHVEQAGGVAVLDIDPDGKITVKGPHLLIDVPHSRSTGSLTIEGTLHVVGDIGSEGDVIADGGSVSLKQHKHGGVQTGGGQTATGTGGAGMPPKDD